MSGNYTVLVGNDHPLNALGSIFSDWKSVLRIKSFRHSQDSYRAIQKNSEGFLTYPSINLRSEVTSCCKLEVWAVPCGLMKLIKHGPVVRQSGSTITTSNRHASVIRNHDSATCVLLSGHTIRLIWCPLKRELLPVCSG